MITGVVRGLKLDNNSKIHLQKTREVPFCFVFVLTYNNLFLPLGSYSGQSQRPNNENLWLRPTFSRPLVPTMICHKQMELRLPIGENLLHPMAQLLNNRTDTFYPLSDHSVFFTTLASMTEAWCSLLGSLDKNRPSSYF